LHFPSAEQVDRVFRVLRFVLVWCVIVASGRCAGRAADAPAPAALEQIDAQWRAVLLRLRRLQMEYLVADAAEQPQLADEYAQAVGEARDVIRRWKSVAEPRYLADPAAHAELGDVLMALAMVDYFGDEFEESARLGGLLLSQGWAERSAQPGPAQELLGMAAFEAGDYAAARLWLEAAQEHGSLQPASERRLAQIDEQQQRWEAELAIRAAEDQADDLPRVRLRTALGDIVVELFENEAPNTVANFLALVESGFYDGRAFYRVTRAGGEGAEAPADSQPPEFGVAEAGSPTDDGQEGLDYRIADECDQENARRHFRGSLSMATDGPDTGGGQLLIGKVQAPHRDGRFTVFGRVIEGQDVVDRLQPTLPELSAEGLPPDRIEEAVVLRKREHPYPVKKLAAPAAVPATP
jgi:cyclophilin family peptidyl-prolyl cis-trans isomerase